MTTYNNRHEQIHQLAAEQALDDRTYFASDQNHIPLPPETVAAIADNVHNVHNRHNSQKLTWGEPAKITQAKTDKVCPCGAGTEDVIFEHTRQIAGFTLDDEGDALCAKCGFAFAGSGFENYEYLR